MGLVSISHSFDLSLSIIDFVIVVDRIFSFCKLSNHLETPECFTATFNTGYSMLMTHIMIGTIILRALKASLLIKRDFMTPKCSKVAF